jgi:hypothetical protein
MIEKLKLNMTIEKANSRDHTILTDIKKNQKPFGGILKSKF